MPSLMQGLGQTMLGHIRDGVLTTAVPLLFFAILGYFVKRGKLVSDVRAALPETKINVFLLILDQIVTLPVLVLLVGGLTGVIGKLGFAAAGLWDHVPVAIVVAAVVITGDLAGYWRHRIEHSRILWPSHAVHHSDTALTWLTIFRFHPLNRTSTVLIDGACLALLGFPPYAVLANTIVRHYYGAFIHADLPWQYGPFKKIFVSPVMHRWHHARDESSYGTNFATVFSLFDVVFGTYRVPGLCNTPLGLNEAMGEGVAGQLLYPLKSSVYFPGSRDEHADQAAAQAALKIL